jgi:hypothetical protein
MGVRDTARFYPIDGQQYPSVTTVLGIIDKSGPLMGWAVKEERRAFEAALLEVLSHDGARRSTGSARWPMRSRASKPPRRSGRMRCWSAPPPMR